MDNETITNRDGSAVRHQALPGGSSRGNASHSPSPAAPTYEPTGRSLAVMDADTLDILRVFRAGAAGWPGAEETGSHSALMDRLRGIAGTDFPENVLFIFHDTYDGSISEGAVRRILRACVSHQADYVRTGDAGRCRRMVLGDVEAITGIDTSVISRATRDVRIISAAGTFTLSAANGSLDVPSLFDEGAPAAGGGLCSRKAVLTAIRDLFRGEDGGAPLTDEAVAGRLAGMGYALARRTVAKYRDLLGIPGCHGRMRYRPARQQG